MRNLWRVLAFDVAAPLGAIGALAMIGIILAWPLWWVALCSVLMLLIVEGVVINFVLARRDSVTVGTDDDAPALRLTGFARWTMPDRDFNRDARDVARIASGMAEATATYSPQDPTASVDRAAAMMVPERAAAFKDQFAKSTADLAQRNVTAQASTLSAGVEALGPSAASVAVVLRATQNTPGQQPSRTVLALRVTLTKNSGHWLVFDVLPIHSR
ncbi:hypothetical protein [Mycobacterium xenopi]|uniref:Transmembrane protein n=1 Tax=Mycobacterium xenopi TaxID=1789 RepID=A0AAD1H4Z6_MYCXE|nr:hypothetical protein [Mycobacterium xenopi]ORX20241.1 hypothetical protein AWC32_06700 [Mycobacterium xenopi]BBU24897.1 hypothetical protein MYXE_46870 [Mycobacterium xenopi]SPX89819.1 conserved transmembrane protein [Mycobacterium xenopi]